MFSCLPSLATASPVACWANSGAVWRSDSSPGSAVWPTGAQCCTGGQTIVQSALSGWGRWTWQTTPDREARPGLRSPGCPQHWWPSDNQFTGESSPRVSLLSRRYQNGKIQTVAGNVKLSAIHVFKPQQLIKVWANNEWVFATRGHEKYVQLVKNYPASITHCYILSALLLDLSLMELQSVPDITGNSTSHLRPLLSRNNSRKGLTGSPSPFYRSSENLQRGLNKEVLFFIFHKF